MPVATPSNRASTARMPLTLSSAATKCISDVPGFEKQTSTPESTSVRTRLSAPFIFVSSPGSGALNERALQRRRSTLHPHHEVEDAARKPRVRRLHEGLHRRDPALLEHGPELREGLEALLPMIMPHAARSDAAERQVVLDDVQDRVIDRDAAGAGVRNQETARRGVAGEGIKGERAVTSIDRVYH